MARFPAGLQRNGRQHGPGRRRRRLFGRRPRPRGLVHRAAGRPQGPHDQRDGLSAACSAPPARSSSRCSSCSSCPNSPSCSSGCASAGELPWATEMLLWISESSPQPAGAVRRCCRASSPLGFFLYLRVQTPEGRRTADYLRIKVPMVGPIFLSFAVARFCRVLGTLLHNGVPILKALEISREASGQQDSHGGDRQGLGKHLVRSVAGGAAGARAATFPRWSSK